ncbi:hypothetical protein BofuT4_uP058820.1 [Botrytis cinerea T4]|uniref:Uncharacterized protein n=1 Tax=Botryotinia fuckeliana (strain T4) TaxID=999810 RepID=G2XUY2_BOTF4|nr:hypothetical protein BofuT4_uP058820.1 [Botrytis cinerea T4]
MGEYFPGSWKGQMSTVPPPAPNMKMVHAHVKKVAMDNFIWVGSATA